MSNGLKVSRVVSVYGRVVLAEVMSGNSLSNLAFLEVYIPLRKSDYTHRDESTNNTA